MKQYGLRLLLVGLVCVFFAQSSHRSEACCGCTSSDCSGALSKLNQYHQEIVDHTKSEFDDDLKAYEDWMIKNFFSQEVLPAMRMMTDQMGAIAMQHTMIIGTFFDAKNQLETQRLFQELTAQAHKDYTPSEQLCWYGTNTKSLAATNMKADYNTYALSKTSLDRQLGKMNSVGAYGVEKDLETRWSAFRKTYCDVSDNNRNPLWAVVNRTGLELACDHNGPLAGGDHGAENETYRVNRDVDYLRLVELPRTIDADFRDTGDASADKADIIALSKNLYASTALSHNDSPAEMLTSGKQNVYLALRSVIAKRSVAEYSFDAIVGLKSAGTLNEYADNSGISVANHTRQYLASIISALYPYKAGVGCVANAKKLCDYDIYQIIGENPSYFAQLEVLGKKMYQNPDFYVKLYDTPANVQRKSVAMRAIDLMMDREIYESQLRREMVASVLLSSKLRSEERRVSERMVSSETSN